MRKQVACSAVAVVLAVGAGQVAAAPERIGSSYVLEVPAPSGFVRVTPDMRAMQRVHDATQPGENRQVRMLATYIPEERAADARRGELVEMDRWCMLQIAWRLQDVPVSREEFTKIQPELVRKLREEGNELLRATGDMIADQGEAMGRAINLELGQLKMGMGGISMLPPHDVVEGVHIGWSGFMRLIADATSAGGSRLDTIHSMTLYATHVDERLLQMVCYGEQGDLDWTRQATKAWSARTRAANP